MKKHKCEACGMRFPPDRRRIYTARLFVDFNHIVLGHSVPTDMMDCPKCGCQVPIATRWPAIANGDDTQDAARRTRADGDGWYRLTQDDAPLLAPFLKNRTPRLVYSRR